MTINRKFSATKDVFWTIDTIFEDESNAVRKEFLDQYLHDRSFKKEMDREELDGYIRRYIQTFDTSVYETELTKIEDYLSNGSCLVGPDISTPELEFLWHMVESYVVRNPEVRKRWGEDIEHVPYHDHWLNKALNDTKEVKIALTLAAVTLIQTHYSPETTKIIIGPPGSWFFQNSDMDFINLDRHAMLGLGLRKSLLIADHETAHAKHSLAFPAILTEASKQAKDLYEKSKENQLARDEYYEYLKCQLRHKILFSVWNAIEDNVVDEDALQDKHGFQQDIPRIKASDFNFIMLMMNGIDTPKDMREMEERLQQEDEHLQNLSEAEKKSFYEGTHWTRLLLNMQGFLLYQITLKTGMIENKTEHWKKLNIRMDWITDSPGEIPMEKQKSQVALSAFNPSGNIHVQAIRDAVTSATPKVSDSQSYTDTDEIIDAVLTGKLNSAEDYNPPTLNERAISKIKPDDALIGFGRNAFEKWALAHAELRAVAINTLITNYVLEIAEKVIEFRMAQQFAHNYDARIPMPDTSTNPVDIEEMMQELAGQVGDHSEALEERLQKGEEKSNAEKAFDKAAKKAGEKGHKHPGYAPVEGLGQMPITPPPGLGKNGFDELEAGMQDYIKSLLAEGLTVEQLSNLQDQNRGILGLGGAKRNPLLPSPGQAGQGGYFSSLEVVDWTQDWQKCVAKLSAPIARIEHLLKDIQDIQWESVIRHNPDLHLLPRSSLKKELSQTRAKKLAIKLAQGTATLSDHYLMETHPPEPIPVDTLIFQMGDGSGSMGRYSENIDTPMGAVIQIMCMTSQACVNLSNRDDFYGGIHNCGGMWGPDWRDDPQSPPLLFKPWDSFEVKRNRIGSAVNGLASGTSASPSLQRIVQTIIEDQDQFGPYLGQVHALYYSDGDIYDAKEFTLKASILFEKLPYFTLNVLTINPGKKNEMNTVMEALKNRYGESRARVTHCNDGSQAPDAAINLLTDIVRTHKSLSVLPTDRIVQDYRKVKHLLTASSPNSASLRLTT